jgi:hypothetical protein
MYFAIVSKVFIDVCTDHYCTHHYTLMNIDECSPVAPQQPLPTLAEVTQKYFLPLALEWDLNICALSVSGSHLRFSMSYLTVALPPCHSLLACPTLGGTLFLVQGFCK